MGRAERRLEERVNRLEENKNLVKLTRHELNEIREEEFNNGVRNNAEIMMTCYGLALKYLYGFGRERIKRTLDYIDELYGDVISGKTTVEKLKDELETVAGITIKS